MKNRLLIPVFLLLSLILTEAGVSARAPDLTRVNIRGKPIRVLFLGHNSIHHPYN